LGVDALLFGEITSRPSGVVISAELVKGTTGWQLWGESFDCASKEILEIQDEIARQISAALRLRLTGDEERRITARYTESSQAYKAYLEGRFHWSRYTRTSIERAIGHFKRALALDSNYALAYAGIVDCYLRLATNYLPPDNDSPPENSFLRTQGRELTLAGHEQPPASDVVEQKVKLRHEWDWKGAERELRRANELKSDYPAAHQWHAAYLLARDLFQKTQHGTNAREQPASRLDRWSKGGSASELPPQIASPNLTPSEEVQVLCAIAREQIDIGNYEAACAVLKRWWSLGQWPKLTGLTPQSCADLLFTAGELAGCVASAKQLPKGQKHGESLLNGSIALFEQIGSMVRAAEGRIELALCYYRQGNFDLGRSTLMAALNSLSEDDCELRGLALIRLASLERHAGRLHDALARLNEAKTVVKLSGPWGTGRCHLELASTYKDLAVSENAEGFFDFSLKHSHEALYEFNAIGSFRLAAIAENNLGFLMVTLGRLAGAQLHLLRSRKIFESLGDKVRQAQVDDTLARLYLHEGKFELAEKSVNRAAETLELGDEDALLAEVLTTKGVIYCKLGRYREAKQILEAAYGVAGRCGDREGAGRALLLVAEEMCDQLSHQELEEIGKRFERLLSDSQQSLIRDRVRKSLELINKLNQQE
jgi:tetratricopeptide (TPR) repeat protein